MSLRRIQICADDFGFDRAISQGILDTIDAGVVSATSCMVLSPAWPHWAPALKEREGLADLGLHLDLNEFAHYAARSLNGWIIAAYRGAVPASLARPWIEAQLDAFEKRLCRAPDYVDGHQHLHQLPGIRDALLQVLCARYGHACALRITRSRQWRGAKAAIIGALGARALAAGARAEGLRVNRDFAGVYEFQPAADFAALLKWWLDSLPDGGLMMCHPGRAGATETRADGIRGARVKEHAVLAGGQGRALLQALGIQPGRCRDWDVARAD